MQQSCIFLSTIENTLFPHLLNKMNTQIQNYDINLLIYFMRKTIT